MTAQKFNPRNPRTLGMEWDVTKTSAVTLDNPATTLVFRETSEATEDISLIGHYVTTPPTSSGVWGAEILRSADAVPISPSATLNYDNGLGLDATNLPCYSLDPTQTNVGFNGASYPTNGTGALIIPPTADVTTTYLTTQSHPAYLTLASPGNAYTFVNDLFGSNFNPATHGIYFLQNGSEYGCSSMATNVRRTLSGRRITSVQVVGKVAFTGGTVGLFPYLSIGGVQYYGSIWQTNGTALQSQQATWRTNPASGQPWTIADIEQFALNYGPFNWWGFKLYGAPTLAPTTLWQTGLIINFVDENRKGHGAATTFVPDDFNYYTMASPHYYNMLHADEASFETSIGGWVATGGTANLTSSATYAAGGGTKSLSVALTSSPATLTVGTANATITQKIPVTSGRMYYGQVLCRAGTTTRSCSAKLEWYNINNTLIGTTSGATASNSNVAFATFQVSGAAPAGSCFARLVLVITSPVSGEVHYIDRAQLNVNTYDPTFTVGGAQKLFVSKTLGEDVMVAFRRLSGSGDGPSVPIMDSGKLVPMPTGDYMQMYQPFVATTAGTFGHLGDLELTAIFGMRMVTTGFTFSPDGIPYSTTFARNVVLASPDKVYSEIVTSPLIASYGSIQAVVSAATDQTVQDLIITLRRSSDDTIAGGPWNFKAADLITPHVAPQKISIQFPNQVQLVAANYYIEFATAETNGYYGWFIYTLQDAITGKGQVRNGGIATAVATEDIIASIAQVAPAPRQFTVVTATL